MDLTERAKVSLLFISIMRRRSSIFGRNTDIFSNKLGAMLPYTREYRTREGVSSGSLIKIGANKVNLLALHRCSLLAFRPQPFLNSRKLSPCLSLSDSLLSPPTSYGSLSVGGDKRGGIHTKPSFTPADDTLASVYALLR